MARLGVFLFLGPDRPGKLRRVHELAKQLGIRPTDRHQLDGATTSSAQLLALCRQQPFESPARLIVVDQAQRLDSLCVHALGQSAEAIALSACLVLLVETDLGERHPLATLGKVATVEQFSIRHDAPIKPFALLDALASQDVAGALSALRQQLAAGRGPLEVLGLIVWQLQRWVVVRRLQEAGDSMERIGSVCNLNPWQVRRIQSEVAGRSLASLQRMLRRCWQLDVEAKSGRANAELAVEQIILEACLSGPSHGVASARNAERVGRGVTF